MSFLLFNVQANLGHWASEIQKHLTLPGEFVITHDPENPTTAEELVNSECRIMLVSREVLTSLHDDATNGRDVWLFKVSFQFTWAFAPSLAEDSPKYVEIIPNSPWGLCHSR